jgi:hypothetical protein
MIVVVVVVVVVVGICYGVVFVGFLLVLHGVEVA